MKIVCISDTHNFVLRDLPEGDVLIHAGDFSGNGSIREIIAFNAWFRDQPHRRKIVIAGNHDRLLEGDPHLAGQFLHRTTEAAGPNSAICYLQDNGVTIDGINFWGTPWTPPFMNWAFMAEEGKRRQTFGQIPDSTDVLITHGPAWGYGDMVERGEHIGCRELLKALARVQPTYHIFGHCHEGYGIWREESRFGVGSKAEIVGINAAICNDRYEPVNKPIVVWI